MTNQETVALTALPRELATLTGKPSPSYRRLYSLTLDGSLPAEQDNGRWFVRRTDLPAIAAMLGLAAPESAKAAATLDRESGR